MKKGVLLLLSVCLLLLAWQLLASAVNQPELIPSIPALINALCQLLSTEHFYQSILATVLRGVSGILLSLVAALITAFLFARYAWLYELFRPLLTIMRAVPVISFILIALLFLNPEGIPLMIAFLTMYPLLTENLTKGIVHLNPGLSRMADRFGLGRINKLTQVIYPQLNPFLFSGLTSAAGFGWRAIIMGEVLSQCTFGIGGEMKRAQLFIAVPELIAWSMVAVLLSFFFDKGISRLATVQWSIRFRVAKADKEALPPPSLLRMTDICFQYADTVVFSQFSYTFEPGRIYGIEAPSGSGKTTLLNLLTGSLKPVGGSIYPDQKQAFAVVYQEPTLVAHLTVLQNVSLPLAALYNRADAEQSALQVLETVEMQAFPDRYPNALSYGQQQRVALARALAYPAAFLLLDEPFKGLDKPLTNRIINRILTRQTTHKQTILFTSHQREETERLADVIIRLPAAPTHNRS